MSVSQPVGWRMLSASLTIIGSSSTISTFSGLSTGLSVNRRAGFASRFRLNREMKEPRPFVCKKSRICAVFVINNFGSKPRGQ